MTPDDSFSERGGAISAVRGMEIMGFADGKERKLEEKEDERRDGRGGARRLSPEGNEGAKTSSMGGGLSGEDRESRKGLNEELAAPSWLSA